MRKRWQTLVPAIGRTSIDTASPAEHGLLVDQRRPVGQRLERVEDRRQLLVLHLDRLRGGARGRAGRRRHGGDDVADVARDVGQHALVLDLAAVAAEVRDVVRCQHDAVVGAGDRQHARVRVRRAHEGGVQHAGPLDLARVALGAGHARIHQAAPTTAHAPATISLAPVSDRLHGAPTSAAITRRRYAADPRASLIGSIRSA